VVSFGEPAFGRPKLTTRKAEKSRIRGRKTSFCETDLLVYVGSVLGGLLRPTGAETVLSSGVTGSSAGSPVASVALGDSVEQAPLRKGCAGARIVI